MWVLLIVAWSSGGLAVHSVPGFATQELCGIARLGIERMLEPAFTPTGRGVCVYQGPPVLTAEKPGTGGTK